VAGKSDRNVERHVVECDGEWAKRGRATSLHSGVDVSDWRIESQPVNAAFNKKNDLSIILEINQQIYNYFQKSPEQLLTNQFFGVSVMPCRLATTTR
jgi:hypothetical protein